ncbi:Mor transcription activator family protein [Paenibacillus catalpae]|uniref:Mor transcription activator family protein n=1 Tax=Paenibacillus catalpae TaxID=1045775 RepID=A0A1I2ANQ6_9BACL|nr:CD3324 family protein [Paenibacillus catalpae]SFE45675.1 Mor transcription activator family protein [Paenibacillus catalpae]
MGRYKNGKDVLPQTLLRQIQQYIDGELLYIPKQSEERAGWGQLSGTKARINDRNDEIYAEYCKGQSIADLERVYFLSGDSLRKIICKQQQNARITSGS